MIARAITAIACSAGLLAVLTGPAWAVSPVLDPEGCAAAIQAAERGSRVPPGLLGSIAMVESGRPDPRTGRASAWPWTINVAGTGYYFQTKGDAITAVEAARAKGVQSIDVGCMQINLLHHPNAFTSLDEAFTPRANATYAASFLTRLFAQAKSWPEAAASYHSQTPGLREDYQRRVMSAWPASGRYGFTAVASAKPVIDPLRLYTPEMRAQLAENASDRAMRVAMGIVRPSRTSREVSVPRSRIRFADVSQARP